MAAMTDEPITRSGWLPPVAPGGPRPRFEPPAGPPAPARSSRQATWALALAIVGLTLLMVSLGTLFLIALPCSTAAWVLALRARSADGEGGQATAALWMARIGVLAGVAAAVVIIALLASGFDIEQFRDDLERELEDRRDRPSSGGMRAALPYLGRG
jgi:hypothetical protein